MESTPSQHKEIVDEVYGFITCFDDGSVSRPTFPGGFSPACAEFINGIASRDVSLDPETGIWARIFLPESVAVVSSSSSSSTNCKAPIVLHFHGGGLCSGSASATAFHTFCSRMATQSQTIWVSVEYRLAPEHRLPAAYDDAFASFTWLHSQASQLHDNVDPWLHDHADFSNCFLAGESSGGAIVHYLTAQIVHKDWSPLQVRGLLIIHAAFLIDAVFDHSLDENFEKRPNTYRRLCLPIGAELDHPLVNPLHPQAPSLKGITLPPSLVAVADQDRLCKPAMFYVEALRQLGHKLDLYVTKGEGHCFYLRYPRSEEAGRLHKCLLEFIQNHCVPAQSQSSL